MTLKEINEQRATLVKQAQAINDKAGGEKRDMTAEESDQFDKIMADVEKLDGDRQKLAKAEERKLWITKQGEGQGRKPTRAIRRARRILLRLATMRSGRSRGAAIGEPNAAFL